MPPKSKRKIRPDPSNSEEILPDQREQLPRPLAMATTVQTPPQLPTNIASHPRMMPQLTLPPITHLASFTTYHPTSNPAPTPHPPPQQQHPYTPPAGSTWTGSQSLSQLQQQQPHSLPSPVGDTRPPPQQTIPIRPGEQYVSRSSPFGGGESDSSPINRSASYNPLKRPFEPGGIAYEKIVDPFSRQPYPLTPLPHGGFPSTPLPSEIEILRGIQFPKSSTSSISDISGPPAGQTSGYYYPSAPSIAGSDYSTTSTAGRCTLFIRQQPRAARAGPDGKDRRAIDPPPVLQLLMNDFDPECQEDVNELKSSFWVVHCRLVSPQSPKKDLSTLSSVAEDGSREIQRLLLGTAVASPFHTSDDPDPENVPSHPTTKSKFDLSTPPSPTSRFFPGSSSRSTKPTTKGKGKVKEISKDPTKLPGAFFIFADISVRKAGEYRLEFSLMKIEAVMMVSGSTLPIIHSVTSDVFKVVNAKDFDQVQPSTRLVRGLLERGAGFPLKLKKGTREGQRRRGGRAGSDSDEDDDDDDDEDGDEDDIGNDEQHQRRKGGDTTEERRDEI